MISVLHHRPSTNRWAEWLHSKFIKVRTTETSLHPRFYHRPSLMRQWKYPEIETPLSGWTVSFVWKSLGVNGNHLKLALANQLMNSGNLGWQHSRNAHPEVVSILKNQPISQDWRCVTDVVPQEPSNFYPWKLLILRVASCSPIPTQSPKTSK